jgi:acyl phosphate:glycerol-3-phosphate acyltransferase
MQVEIIVASLLAGYLFGSISVSRIVARICAPSVDLTRIGVKDPNTGEFLYLSSIGANTVSIKLGPKVGGIIGILDILKGIIPPLIFRLLFPDYPYYLLAGVTVVAGHIWTLYHRFKGGSGISPALGAFLVADPLGMIVANLVAMFLGFFVFREFLIVITAGTWLMIPWLWLRTGRWEMVVYALLINLMMVLAMIPDVGRYIRTRKTGTVSIESVTQEIPMVRMMNRMMERLGSKKRGAEPPVETATTGGEQ